MACKVCLACGIPDPEAWLDQVNPRTLALWEAFYRVDPWGSDYERWALQAQLTDSMISFMAATAGQKRKTLSMKDFMPGNWVGATPVKPKKRKGRKQMRAASHLCAAMFPNAARR